MASERWAMVLVLGMCCFALQSQGQAGEDIAASFSDPAVQAWVQAASVEASGISRRELPVARPGQGGPYRFCTLSSCATSVTVKAKNGFVNPANNITNGLLYMDLRYKPIPGVNSTMMMWMFESMKRKAVYAPTNTTFDMYLIFHPRDHVFHDVQKLKDPSTGRTYIGPGANLTWCEMILSNCQYQINNATEPWVCPVTARGFLRSDNTALWSNKYKTRETMVVHWFNSTGIEFSRYETNAFPKPRVVATTRHTWSDTASGNALVRMRTQLWIGLMKSGTTTVFDDNPFIGTVNINDIIASTIMRGTSDLTSQNATALGYMNALHFIEEYGGTRSWLPAVWRARTP